MTIIIRADASLQMGSGHVMRCLTLADELRQQGAEVLFICREHPGNLIEIIQKKGYQVARLPQIEAGYTVAVDDVAHATWLGCSWQHDASTTIEVLRGIRPEWLIIDHYAIDYRWEQKLRPHVGKIMIIDDLADRQHDCEVLLDQNLYQSMEVRYENLIPGSCKKLLGPRFALLRPEFAAARKNLCQRDGHVKRILVFFGGVDPTNETEKVLQALSGITDRTFEVDVVVGIGNIQKERIKSFCSTREGFNYHCQINNMAELMAGADLAVGAGGTATWERCALGVPAIVTAIAANQKELAETGALHGLFFYLGEACTITMETLSNALRFSLNSPDTLLFYGKNGLMSVDARGAVRISALILPPRLTLRRASMEDCEAVYRWRNAEETRQYVFNSESISFNVHRDWFFRTIENQDKILLIGEIENKPIGVIRYDITASESLISVYLVPGSHGRGLGSHLIRCGSQWLREHKPRIRVVNAKIFRDNIASLHAFEAAGFKEHHLIFQETLW